MWLPGVSVVMGVVTFHNGILLQKPVFFSEELDIFLSVPSAEAPAVFSIGQHVMGSASPFITRSLALP